MGKRFLFFHLLKILKLILAAFYQQIYNGDYIHYVTFGFTLPFSPYELIYY